MDVFVYNNLTRKKEILRPLNQKELLFYSCGPTVYDFLHVGNARAAVVADLIHRSLRAFGYKVKFVRNFTDVDDKILERARESKIHPKDHAKKFIDECLKDYSALNMLPPSVMPTVSETMPEIIAMIECLINKGHAYTVPRDGGLEVLYSVPSFKEYGKLSKVKLESLLHGARVETDGQKKNPSDFVLWKPAKPEEGWSFESPWGKGRPGWHIECSAMAKKHLGDTIDLHHGGVDLIFPHHENEVAQSEAANGCTFCQCWAHNEFVNFGAEKMSKSLGNVITIRNFNENFSGGILRHIVLSVHYRSKLDWTEESIARALSEMERLHEFKMALSAAKEKQIAASKDNYENQLSEQFDKIKSELASDFNVPGAMGIFFGVIKDFNRIANSGELTAKYVDCVSKITAFISEATGLVHERPEIILSEINRARMNLANAQGEKTGGKEEVEELLKERKSARASKNWARSDEIRDRLAALKVEVKDHPDGSYSWSYKL